MIDILDTTGRATCGNCGGKIVRLVGSMTAEHWTHETEDGKLIVPCPGAPVATPVENEHADQMSEAVTNMVRHRAAALTTDRKGWTEQQWIDDAEKLMGDLHGSVASLVNGHVTALLHRVERMTRVADLCHWRQNRGGVQATHSHLRFHFDNPCPYEAVAAILRGEPDPREHS